MLNSSERSNSVSRSCRSEFRVRAENPNSLITMTCSLLELGVVSAAPALWPVFAETAYHMLPGLQPLSVIRSQFFYAVFGRYDRQHFGCIHFIFSRAIGEGDA